MKFVIDTHIYLWSLAEPSRIAAPRLEMLQLPTNTVYVSAISIAELMIKASIGKLKIDFDPVVLAEESGFELLDFSGMDALALGTLPFHHRDPFDRMLIAQCMARQHPIMTDDAKFKRYDCRLI